MRGRENTSLKSSILLGSKQRKGFPGSFQSGGSYLGARERLRIKGTVCSVEGMEAERGYFMLSISHKEHLLRLTLPVLDSSQAQYLHESSVRKKEIWRWPL